MELKSTEQDLPKERESAFNRTLWNWNYRAVKKADFGTELLIVPYGIEIALIYTSLWADGLLIVPYGIEM